MPYNPISRANLKPPWQPGINQPTAGIHYVERLVTRAQKAGPQAFRLLHQAMRNPELPMSLRCRIAEYIVDKAWPKEAQNSLISGLSGVEFLELRFVAPGQQPEPHRMPLIEAEASDISDIAPDANDLGEDAGC